jgi:hypothetical protein
MHDDPSAIQPQINTRKQTSIENNYRRMEHDRGDYKIPDDDKIVPIGDKFSVPPAVVRNFQDLSNARN